MKKPEVNPEIYRAWDKMHEQMEQRSQKMFFPGVTFPKWDEAYPLAEAIRTAPGITGRNRKREEQLVLVPRFVLKFLTDEMLTHIASYEKKE